MRSTMRLMIVLGIAFYALTPRGGGALAQTAAPQPAPEMKTDDLLQGDITSDIELTRASIQVRRQALVTAAMDLAPKDADVFWPLYREYREEMAKVNDRFVRLLVGYLENYDSLTDEAARKMLDEIPQHRPCPERREVDVRPALRKGDSGQAGRPLLPDRQQARRRDQRRAGQACPAGAVTVFQGGET